MSTQNEDIALSVGCWGALGCLNCGECKIWFWGSVEHCRETEKVLLMFQGMGWGLSLCVSVCVHRCGCCVTVQLPIDILDSLINYLMD